MITTILKGILELTLMLPVTFFSIVGLLGIMAFFKPTRPFIITSLAMFFFF